MWKDQQIGVTKGSGGSVYLNDIWEAHQGFTSRLVFTKQTFSFSALHPPQEAINICGQHPTTPQKRFYMCVFFSFVLKKLSYNKINSPQKINNK